MSFLGKSSPEGSEHPAGSERTQDVMVREEVISKLAEISEDLAYLCLATLAGLKPLSRFEASLPEEALRLLEKIPIHFAKVIRNTDEGSSVSQLIFSLFPELLKIYQSAFSGAPLKITPHEALLEGFLFGYPPCCIASYVQEPYAQHSLPEEDQKILFHWACKDCSVTPHLLPAYRKIYGQVSHKGETAS